MDNLVLAIQKHLARSVRKRVKLVLEVKRERGSARHSVLAALMADDGLLFKTCGTIGFYPFKNAKGCACILCQNLKDALYSYPTLSIDQILKSDSVYIRALGLLDARVGKNRLAKITINADDSIARSAYMLRCRAESMLVEKGPQTLRSAKVEPKYTLAPEWRDDDKIFASILRDHKRQRNVESFLDQVQQGMDLRRSDCRISRILQKYIKGRSKKEKAARYVELLKSIADASKLVNERYMLGLMEMIRDQYAWIRPVDAWRCRTHNADKQFSSLARHLFSKYHVPLFMDEAWLTGNRLYQSWFKHIGSGNNIRTAQDLPLPLTKMMAHHFLATPDNYRITSAFRRAQARALGANEPMAAAIAQTRLSDTFRDNEFWLSVIGFFARNPMLDCAQVGPIVDYIWSQKYDDVIVQIERERAENRGPAQPNFSMKGRTVVSLMQQVERWHGSLSRYTGADVKWEHSSISEFEFVEGSTEGNNLRTWRIVELLSKKELVGEGRELQHCVASYADSCARGYCAIMSMTLAQPQARKVLTIEVNLKGRKIHQVRGKRNRLASEKEREVIQRWATAAGLNYE